MHLHEKEEFFTKLFRTIGVALTAICLIALMVAAASAADLPGPSGQGGKNGNAQGGNGIQAYTISQTISDQAQQNTIAFDGLAFMTGDACSDTFIPPGKVADYAGFQYLRDNDRTQMGHNTDFVTRTADNVLVTLNSDQLAQFVTLSQEESPLTTQYGLERFPLATAFRSQYAGTLPSGSTGLDKAAVMAWSGSLYDIDANISIARAKTYASVINSLNQSQRAYLDQMKSEGLLAYPVVDASAVLKNSGQGNSVAMRTYASEMFAWYAGSVDADVYFCPERQATYFGSFYMKDRPAMGNAGYSISTTLTGDSGADFLVLLTADQRAKITGLVDLQRADLNDIVATRKAIATELRRPLTGGTIDENAVHTLSEHYGALDGEISYYYATHFAEVGSTLTSDQKAKMVALRNLSSYSCQGAFLYSQPISMPQNIPSAFLFGAGTYDPAAMTAWVQGATQSVSSQAKGTGAAGQDQNPQGGRVTGANTTQPAQGSGTSGGKGPGRVSGGGNTTAPGQGNGKDRQSRMPVDMIITQLGQQGYDISGATASIQSGDRQAQKAWLDTFRQNNPGVAEAIEATWTGDSTGGKGGNNGSGSTGTSAPPARGQPQDAKSLVDQLRDWFSRI